MRRSAILSVLLMTVSCFAADPSPSPSLESPQRLRIIATAPSNAEIVCALGACDCLVGVSPFVTYPPELAMLPKVGGLHDPDLETVLTLRPDIVLVRGHNHQLERLCDANNIRRYDDKTDSLASLYVTIRDIGELTGRTKQADQLCGDIQRQLDRVRAQAGDRPKPRVLLTIRSPDRLASITTVAGESYLSSLIEIAGGSNIFGKLDTAYPQVTLEDILAGKPDVIIEAMPGENLNEEQQQRLRAQWKGIADPAHVCFLTEDCVLFPSPRVPLVAEKIQQLLFTETTSRE